MADIPAYARPAVDALRTIGGDELVREMMATFLRFADAQVQRLRDAAAASEAEQGAAIAHTLKMSARQMGAVRLGDACDSAELAARGGDAAGLHRSAESVAEAFEAARPWIEELAAPRAS